MNMKVNCECGCGGIIEYAPGDSLYLPGHHPNPIKEIITENVSLKRALGDKGFKLKPRQSIHNNSLTRAIKKTIRNKSDHRCFLCGRFETGYKKAFSVCVIDAHGTDIAIVLCNKCKTNKDRLSVPMINKFNALKTNNIYKIDQVLIYTTNGRKEESGTNP